MHGLGNFESLNVGWLVCVGDSVGTLPSERKCRVVDCVADHILLQDSVVCVCIFYP